MSSRKENNIRRTLLRTLPYIGAVAFFLLLAIIYFEPQMEGQKLPMGDITQYEGMSREIKQMQQSAGEDPQWTGAAFSGMPAYMINIHYPGMIIKNYSEALCRLLDRPAVLIFLALVSFWVMLLLWGVNPIVAIVPAIAYGLSTYSMLIIGAGHITKMFAFAYAPLLVGAVVYTLRGGNILLGSLLAALFAALQIGANHPQISYYFILVIAAAWINELVGAVRKGQLRSLAIRSAALVGAAVLAVGANFSSLYYTAQYQGETTRGGSELADQQGSQSTSDGLDIAYATAWSYGIDESLNLFVPNLMGGASDAGGFARDGKVADSLRPYGARSLAQQLPSYWGDQPYTAGPTYLGAAAIFLAVLGMFLLRGREKWWLMGVSIFALLLSWGSNLMWFTELMFKWLPLYDKFRAVSTALVIVQWTVPTLGAVVLWRIFRGDFTKADLMRGVRNALYVTGGVAVAILFFGGEIFSFTSPVDMQLGLPEDVVAAMQAERADMLRSDALRSLLFVALSAAVVALFASGRLGGYAMVGALGVLVCADLVGVDTRYLSWDDFSPAQEIQILPSEANLQIMADKELGYRVANFAVGDMFSDATTSYFHRSVGGYHSAKLSRYQDLITHQLRKGNPEVFDMLNTKYFIVPDQQSGAPTVVVNDMACGAAWFVEEIAWAGDAKEQMELLDTTPVESVAIVEECYKEYVAGAELGQGDIFLTDYQPNHLTYAYRSDKGGLCVFSEIHYPKGWRAYVDGKEVPYIRANYLLRAMVLPAGDHTVEFRFRAPNFKTVELVSLLSSLIILGGVVAVAIATTLSRTKKRVHQSE